MNNQVPFMDPNSFGGNTSNFGGNFGGQNFILISIERINNRLNRLERQVRILENRVNRLSNNNPSHFSNEFDDNNNMYML